MAYENVEFPASNMTGDRTNTNLYCFNNGVLLVKQRSSPYNLVALYPTDRYLGDVVCTQFDGVYYWTMESQVSGFKIQKWELVSGILRWRDSFSFVSSTSITYDSECFVVEYYSDTLGASASPGQAYVEVSDGDIFNIGDNLVLGPSSFGGYSGEFESAEVTGKAGNILSLSGPLTKGFTSGNEVYVSRFFYIFNKYSPSDKKRGSLLKYDANTGLLYSYASSHMYGEVKAAAFYDDKITFVKGHEVVQVIPATMAVYKHFAIDNLETDRAHIVPIEALWVYADVVYRLQGKHVFYYFSCFGFLCRIEGL